MRAGAAGPPAAAARTGRRMAGPACAAGSPACRCARRWPGWSGSSGPGMAVRSSVPLWPRPRPARPPWSAAPFPAGARADTPGNPPPSAGPGSWGASGWPGIRPDPGTRAWNAAWAWGPAARQCADPGRPPPVARWLGPAAVGALRCGCRAIPAAGAPAGAASACARHIREWSPRSAGARSRDRSGRRATPCGRTPPGSVAPTVPARAPARWAPCRRACGRAADR